MEFNGYMIKQAIRELERARDAISLKTYFTPNVVKLDDNKVQIWRELPAQECQAEFSTSLQLISDLDEKIIKLLKLQRAYNAQVGIHDLLDKLASCTRKVNLLQKLGTTPQMSMAWVRRNDNAVAMYNLAPERSQFTIENEYIDHAALLQNLLKEQDKIKNAIGVKNATMATCDDEFKPLFGDLD